MKQQDLEQCIVYRCIVGSRAFGLDVEASDTDYRGIFVPPADLHWSLDGVPEQIELEDSDEIYWELQKFLRLALRANPNVLECLYTPLVEKSDAIATELLNEKQRFLSKLVYQKYNGYAISQFRKLEQELRNRGEIKWKHVMHLIRLLLSGTTLLEDAYVAVNVGEHRDLLMAIRRGELPWDDVNTLRLDLHRKFDQAFDKTTLPERPDVEWVNAFLIKARRSMV